MSVDLHYFSQTSLCLLTTENNAGFNSPQQNTSVEYCIFIEALCCGKFCSASHLFRSKQNEVRHKESENQAQKHFSSIICAWFSHRGLERSAVFAINSTQYCVKMLDNTQSIICAFSLSCYEFIAKTSSNYSSVKNCEFLVRKVQLG